MSVLAAAATALALSSISADLSDLSPADKADLQCLAVTVYTIGTLTDEIEQASVATGATYFYGRLTGRSPETNWMDRLIDYVRAEPNDDIEANRARCADEMAAMSDIFVSGSNTLYAE